MLLRYRFCNKIKGKKSRILMYQAFELTKGFLIYNLT